MAFKIVKGVEEQSSREHYCWDCTLVQPIWRLFIATCEISKCTFKFI